MNLGSRIRSVLSSFDFTQENGNQRDLLKAVWGVLYPNEPFNLNRFVSELRHIDVYDKETKTAWEFKREGLDLDTCHGKHAGGQDMDPFEQVFSYDSVQQIRNHYVSNKKDWRKLTSPKVTVARVTLDSEDKEIERFFSSMLISEEEIQSRNCLKSYFDSTFSAEKRKKGGIHYTPLDLVDRILEDSFLRDFRLRINTAQSVEELKDIYGELTKIKVFDPACGSGHFLIIAWSRMLGLETRLRRRLLDFGCTDFEQLPSCINASNFYGIEIEKSSVLKLQNTVLSAYHKLKHKYPAWDDSTYPEMNLLCADALSVDWVKFTHGTDPVYLVSNPPFISHYHSEYQLVAGTSDISWLNKAYSLGYTGSMIMFGNVAYGKTRAVIQSACPNIKFSPRFDWKGDAETTAVVCYFPAESETFFFPESRSHSITGLPKLNSGYNVHSFGSGSPCYNANCLYYPNRYKPRQSSEVPPLRDILVLPTVTIQFKAFHLRNAIPLSALVWTDWDDRLAVLLSSRVFNVWCARLCVPMPAVDRPHQIWHFNQSYVYNNFPLSLEDDLSHFDSMSDEEIWNELLDRYRKLVNKV